MCMFVRHFQNGNDIAAQLQISLVHFLQRRVGGVPQQFIGQQHGEGLSAYHVPGAPHGMTKACRFLLAHEDHAAWLDLGGFQNGEFRGLALGLQAVDQLAGDIKIILQRALAAGRHENQPLDAGGQRFVHRILQQWLVDDGEHFLGHGLGGRQEARALAAHRKNGGLNGFDRHIDLCVWQSSIANRDGRSSETSMNGVLDAPSRGLFSHLCRRAAAGRAARRWLRHRGR